MLCRQVAASHLFCLFSAAAAWIGAEEEDGGIDQGAQDPTRQAGASQARAQACKLPSLPLLSSMFHFQNLPGRAGAGRHPSVRWLPRVHQISPLLILTRRLVAHTPTRYGSEREGVNLAIFRVNCFVNRHTSKLALCQIRIPIDEGPVYVSPILSGFCTHIQSTN